MFNTYNLNLNLNNVSSVDSDINNSDNNINIETKKIIKNYNNNLLNLILTPTKKDKYIYNINNHFKSFMDSNFIIQSDDTFDFIWLNESIRYTQNLSNMQKYIIRKYTYNGDKLVNTYIRNPDILFKNNEFKNIIYNKYDIIYAVQLLKYHNISNNDINNIIESDGSINEYEMEKIYNKYILHINDNIILHLIDNYKNDLCDIINNAPKPSRAMKLFRGVSNDYIKELNKPYEISGFQSTTYHQDVAYDYMTRYNISNPSIYEIIILPDTPCLAIEKYSSHSSEFEIIINTHTYGTCTNKIKKFLFTTNEVNNILPQIMSPDNDMLLNTSKIIIMPNTNNINSNNKTYKKKGGNLHYKPIKTLKNTNKGSYNKTRKVSLDEDIKRILKGEITFTFTNNKVPQHIQDELAKWSKIYK